LDKDFDHHSLEDMQQNLTPNNMDQDITDWLRQALIENPKVDYDPMARKFMFKPSLPIKKRSDLGKLLRQYDEKGLGGVMMGDIGEALANPEKVVKKLGDSALVIQRQDKEKVVFYKNPNLDIEVDEDIQGLWRAVSVDGMGEADISKYLQNVGLTAMEDTVVRKRKVPGQQSRAKRKSRVMKVQNVHLEQGILKDYSDKGEGTGKNIQQ
jgi:transcription initiation factor TFIIE subunit beta